MQVTNAIAKFAEQNPSIGLYVLICKEIALASWASKNHKTANRLESEWDQHLQELLQSLTASLDESLEVLQRSAMPGVRYATGETEASQACDMFSRSLLEQQSTALGIDFATRKDIPATVFVTIWRDC